MSLANPLPALNIDQLIAICQDLRNTIEVLAMTMKHIPPSRARDAIEWRRHHLRDIKLLLEQSWKT